MWRCLTDDSPREERDEVGVRARARAATRSGTPSTSIIRNIRNDDFTRIFATTAFGFFFGKPVTLVEVFLESECSW